MITSIKFKEDYVCFFKDQKFDLKPITLLVGDQGCGKSTLLSLIGDIVKDKDKSCVVKRNKPEQTKLMKLDLEKDNPRTGPGGNPNSSQDLLYSMSVKFQSHGEVLVPILDVINTQSDAIILLDEPETSLSLRSQYMMIDVFKNALKRNNQLILATHNLVFMQAFEDSILSLEHNKYVTSTEFVELQHVSSDFKEVRQDIIIKKTHCKLGNACTCANETGWYNNACLYYINSRGVRHAQGPEK